MADNSEICINFGENLSQTFDGPKTTLAYLIGVQNRSANECNVFNAVFVDPLTPDLAEFKFTLENQLPAGFEVIGLWNTDFTSKEIILEWLELKSLSQEFKNIITLASPADQIKSKTIRPEHLFLLNVENAVFHNENYRAVNFKRAELLTKRTVSFRIACSLPVMIHLLDGVTEHEFTNEMSRAFENLENRFSSISDNNEEHVDNDANMYKTMKGNLLLNFSVALAADEFSVGEKLGPESTCYELWRHIQTDEKISKRKELTFYQDVIDLKLLHNVSDKRSSDKSAPFVPVIHYEMCEFYSCTILLKLNAVAVCSQDTKIVDLAHLFRISLLRQIKSAKHCMRTFSDFKDKKNIPIPESFVFYIEHMRQFLIEFYPKNFSNDSLKQFRRSICSIWNLSIDRPLITRQNSYVFPSEAGVYLRNVHEFVPSPGGGAADNGTTSIVIGVYQYHHYMQDNTNDNGWGCAYRSFQTIWSWFLLQGYTEKPVPSHREIQQALVDIGDRPVNFVGTKQWIGSLELSFCLSHLLQMESKILNINSGSELISKVRELMKHFDTEGTPIMIGGGVLAHTILGVYFNEETGQAKFLVLDPHYTGDENIKTIVDKGWCGWKQPTFWSEGAFYNLLLPQRPTGVF